MRAGRDKAGFVRLLAAPLASSVALACRKALQRSSPLIPLGGGGEVQGDRSPVMGRKVLWAGRSGVGWR